MQITKTTIKLYNKDKTRAFAQITLYDEFMVTGLKVIEGSNGLFVSMPNRAIKKDDKTEYVDIAFPLSKECRKVIQDAVLTEYHKENGTYDEPIIEAPSENEEQKKWNSIDVSEDMLPF